MRLQQDAERNDILRKAGGNPSAVRLHRGFGDGKPHARTVYSVGMRFVRAVEAIEQARYIYFCGRRNGVRYRNFDPFAAAQRREIDVSAIGRILQRVVQQDGNRLLYGGSIAGQGKPVLNALAVALSLRARQRCKRFRNFPERIAERKFRAHGERIFLVQAR